MPRRDRTPDTRLNWRDPNMPVLRKIIYEGGWGVTPEIKLEALKPSEESEYAAQNMSQWNLTTPHWSKDPTYNLNRNPNRRRR